MSEQLERLLWNQRKYSEYFEYRASNVNEKLISRAAGESRINQRIFWPILNARNTFSSGCCAFQKRLLSLFLYILQFKMAITH